VNTFGETFREILRQRDLTQVDAAKLLETSQSVISKYCNLKDPPRPRIVGWISTRLGVGIPELTGATALSERTKSRATKIEADDPIQRAMSDLKHRWKKKPHERATIRHLVGALFPRDAQRIVAWLEKSN